MQFIFPVVPLNKRGFLHWRCKGSANRTKNKIKYDLFSFFRHELLIYRHEKHEILDEIPDSHDDDDDETNNLENLFGDGNWNDKMCE